MDHGHMLPVRVFMNVHHGLTVSGAALAEPLALLAARSRHATLCALSSLEHIHSGVRL